MAETTWLWWSSGKDSAWALEVLRRQGTGVAALVTTVNRQFGRVAMHAVRESLLQAQARATGLPLHTLDIPHPCSNAEYERAVAALLESAQAAGVTAMAFGDIFLSDIRTYRERLLRPAGIQPLFPLWQRDTTRLAAAMVDAGLRATVTCVDPRQAPSRIAGATFDRSLLDSLPPGVDPCGENGEFHTFAWAGPMFSEPLQVIAADTVNRDGFVFTDLTLVSHGSDSCERSRDPRPR